MKRTFAIVIGLASVGAAIYFGSRLGAQPGTPPPPTGTPAAAPPPPPRTAVRIVNLSFVVKRYNKWLNFQNEYKAKYKSEYENKLQDLQNKLKDATAKIQDIKTSGAEKEAAEKTIRTLQRQIQELGEDAKQTLGKMEADIIVRIYREIEDEVHRFARANAIDLVMHYNDATEPTDLHSPANVTRKISSGECVPMYYTAGMDISYHILQILNSRVPPPSGAGAAAQPSGNPPSTGGRPAGTTIQPVGGTQSQPPRQP